MTTNSKIRSLSEKQALAAVNRLFNRHGAKALGPKDTRAVVSDCIEELGGLMPGITSQPSRKDWWFFRVRKFSSFSPKDDLSDPAMHSYPPENLCDHMGRCHVIGEPVFYCSDSLDGAFDEMKSPEETEYLLSIWKLADSRIVPLKYLCGSNIQGLRLIKHKGKILNDAKEQHGHRNEEAESRLVANLVAWSNLFIASNYSLSASIAHQTLYGDFSEGHDLIAYGSAINGAYINFALPTDLADCLILYRIFKVKYTTSLREIIWNEYVSPLNGSSWMAITPDVLPQNDPNIPTQYQVPLG